MTVDISGKMDQEAFGNILKAYNSLIKGNSLDIYLNSDGGDPEIADAIADLIENTDYLITIIGYGKLFSAAFDLYFKARCHKRLLAGTVGMSHLARVETEEFDSSNAGHKIEMLAYKKWLDNDKKERLKFYEYIGMEAKELSRIKKGGDVYFQYNRLLELLNGKS